jgi:hypothetical protein
VAPFDEAARRVGPVDGTAAAAAQRFGGAPIAVGVVRVRRGPARTGTFFDATFPLILMLMLGGESWRRNEGMGVAHRALQRSTTGDPDR